MAEAIKKVWSLILSNKDLMLEAIGEEILRRAKANAEQGYVNVPFTGDTPVVWPQRQGITERLYQLSPHHRGYSHTGMDTGKRKLIGSLERYGIDNVFDRGPDSIEVGTKFKHAALLEKGGIRPAFPNIGFRDDGSPNRWLREAIQQGLITEEEVWLMQDVLFQPQPVEGRPFLAPALRDIRDKGDALTILIDKILEEIQVDLELEGIKIRAGETLYVSK